ncbi:NAD(P)/FAD-dependent oxidoreductase [Streptomyces inhibens]|uniref:NAD(P)/FAD-dependent oxidoreductase n=2 Tax=Streptomyces inhibens TaxID=2293571 RepID=A0A371PQG3_STRIH|nr:NAD(P)/FAD-dependent oxidoreductase [Streptomyces inhibens]
MNTRNVADLDVVVVGGGVAGLSGALTLARARRSVLVIDSGEPRNAPASGVHGFLSHDGLPPRELLRAGREEVTGYGGRIMSDRVTAVRRADEHFVVDTEGGRSWSARRLLVTTGLVDELPDVPGLRERWGREVLHCPYCHGWEVRDTPIGVLATGPGAVHQALLFRQWSPDVTLFLHTADDPVEEQWEQLAARGIAVVDGRVVGLDVADDRLSGVRLASGACVPVRALAVRPRFEARDGVLSGLGPKTVEHPLGVGSYVESDGSGRTGVAGVWVAGNVTDLMGGVAVAAASGVQAASAINADLVAADTAAAVGRRVSGMNDSTHHTNRHTRRTNHSTEAERFWERHYSSHERVGKGTPNPVLADVARALSPGDALDLGCGEGGDAVWLAAHGWRVTAVDVSATALSRTVVHGTEAGVAERLTTERHDLARTFPAGTFDLVSAQYLHTPLDFPRSGVLRKAAHALAPGGLLLIVDHGSVRPWAWNPDPHTHFPTPEDIYDGLALDPDRWHAERLDRPRRQATGPDGRTATVTDHVIAVRRRAA